ncbi:MULTISPECIES: SDR family oxidoreductase [Streptomyces]|jgi:NAD(P)-dependent dehydrogenase (short-subunit alcohol dehydrogenase family)|uniref:SDR family oxidoreductase n=2 Tax=Streptomyces rochei group TaxID=2867164 RepID=A0AAX3ZAS7_STRRO|nr:MULTISPECIES: SDR family oxidoreductase [Streptomyces]RIH59557.1 SDR family oxidoreductase [Streptomyces sp. SHP22-7]WDI16084.1 SDR family oxidoreductase [Streptomyces enissocaesilis]KYK11989.1 dehydrogenase [Streptomyces sp. CC71]MBQ0883080.1 SDR family oxidoreductase [Streptomyces sp. RT42]MBQ0916766.1 SDR family oxidoreductase [Streptomyces sp. RM99]
MTDKIALITGANKGIGFEIARQLGELGITAVIGARDEQRGKEAAEQLGQPYVQLDVTDPDSVEAAARWIEAEYGRLDILVNNAGVTVPPPQGTPSATTAQTLRRIYETNVFGVVTVTNAMLPLLRKSPAARIVNQSSELGSKTQVMVEDSPLWPLNNMPYNSSKAALNMITVTYAKELWGTPIKVNACDPGYCITDINNGMGFITAAEGARIAVRLATLDADGPNAQFFKNEGPLPW